MAVKVRLRRTGARNDASFRVVAADARSPRDGRCLEVLGWYDPRKEGVNFDLKLERIQYWHSRGARISDTVRSLMQKAGKAAPAPEPVVVETPPPASESAEEAAAPPAEEEQSPSA
jgi:small subunit ribosomal protein S16